MLPFPNIDPVALQIGPVALRWYGLAYVAGILLAWKYCIWLIRRYEINLKEEQFDAFIIWALAGIIIGGRLGYVLFYGFSQYLEAPWRIFMTWEGGMSFHGGLIGVIIASLIFCKREKISMRRFGDILGSAAPIGLFLGRLANFVNGELYGRLTDVPWAMVFPSGGPWARHPSQLYEALTEGLLLSVIVFFSWKWKKDAPGFQTGLFLIGYALARSFCELYREPDALWAIGSIPITIGQALSLPLIVLGVYYIRLSKKN